MTRSWKFAVFIAAAIACASPSRAGQGWIERTSLRVVPLPAGDLLNVRAAAGATNEVLTRLSPGERGIERIGEEKVGRNSWQEVKFSDDSYLPVSGWVSSQYVEPDTAVFSVIGVAADDLLNIRSEPRSKVIGNIPPDSEWVIWLGKRAIVEGDQDWLLIQHDSVRGWVNGRFLERVRSELEVVAPTSGGEIRVHLKPSSDSPVLDRISTGDGETVDWSGGVHQSASNGSDWLLVETGMVVGWVRREHLTGY